MASRVLVPTLLVSLVAPIAMASAIQDHALPVPTALLSVLGHADLLEIFTRDEPARSRPDAVDPESVSTALTRLGAGDAALARGREVLAGLPTSLRASVEAILVEMASCSRAMAGAPVDDHACASRLAATIDAVARAPPEPVVLSVACEPIAVTEAGLTFLAIGGAEDNCYDMGPTLLSLDLGGNDVYNNPAGVAGLFCCSNARVSVALDFSGADVYTYQQGSAANGVGILLDVSGDDSYSSMTRGDNVAPFQATSFGGVGILWDMEGNDTYRCLEKCQGASFNAGLGLLWDATGDDVYLNTNGQSQGWGGPNRGAIGVLHDGEGNDRYSAFGTSQGFAYQGAAGVLIDMSGNDEYAIVGVNGRATFGSGAILFADLDGVDTYLGPVSGANNARWGGGVGGDASVIIGYDCTPGQLC